MLRDRTGGSRAAATLFVVAALTLTAAPGARADFDQVAMLFASGAWDQARGQAAEAGSGARPAESVLWRSRLATDTTSALDLLREGLTQKRLGRQVRARLALETADLELGRGHPSEALAVLTPLLKEGNDLPGDVPLVAARALLTLGRGPRAGELLATVRPSDPAFARSQALLGDIAIARGDGAQALRWYDAADQADPQLRRRTVAGRCRAMLLGGRVGEVEALAAQLDALDPGSLALLEIRRALHDHQDVETTRLPTNSPPAGAAYDDTRAQSTATQSATNQSTTGAGRYTLQLGAFGDRGRALEFQQRQADRVEGLTIEQGVDARGQNLYRLRAGAFLTQDEAETAASDLGDSLGLDVIVVDREATARTDR
jgi:cell division septation protein DedD